MLGRAAVRFATAIDKPALGYLIAGLSVGAAVAGRMALGILVATPLTFATYYPAVMIAALIGGLGPGLAATVGSGAAAAALWLVTDGRLPETIVSQLVTFWLATGLMVLICAGLRIAVRRGFEVERRFRAAQEASREAFVILAPIRDRGEIVDFRWIYANPAADALRPPRSATLVSLTVRSAYPGEHNDAMLQRLLTLHREGGPDDLQVSRTFNGEQHWMRSSGVRLGDELAITFSDITEERAAEEAAEQFRRDLELRVAERTQALEASLEERARAEAALAQAQRLETVGRLTGGVAHDFNNLLTAIQLRLDELLQRHPVGDPSYEGLVEIRQTGVRAADLVRKLLAFSRKQTVQRVVLDLGELISEFEVLLRRVLREDVKLITDYGRDPPSVRADKSQLETAVMNLVINARDALLSSKGTGSVRIRTARLSQAEAQEAGYPAAPSEMAMIEVSDDGPGIPPEVIGKIFDPFFTTKPVGEGTGLGLATVYGIVKQSDGWISVDSKIGEGTAFRIFLPTHAPAAAVAPETIKPRVARDLSGAGRILFVEDEDAVRGVAARLLRARGYEVIEACDGEEALQLAEDNAGKIDLLISDVIMPGIDGPTLLKKARQFLGNAPVMFISGYAEAEFSDLLEGEEGVSFLPKPIDIKTLAERVKQQLQAA